MRGKLIIAEGGALARELDDILADPQDWLALPNDHFWGRRPIDLIDTEDEYLLWEWIAAVKCGLPS
jgi:hypothetical protein